MRWIKSSLRAFVSVWGKNRTGSDGRGWRKNKRNDRVWDNYRKDQNWESVEEEKTRNQKRDIIRVERGKEKKKEGDGSMIERILSVVGKARSE